MKTIQEMQARIEEIEKERAAIFEAMRPFQERNSSLCDERKNLLEQITVETMKIDQSIEDRFAFLMAENGYSSDMTRYNEASKMLSDLGLYMSGYCQFSQEHSASVFIYYNDTLENQKSIEALKKIIPLFKPMNEDGEKYFNVFCKDQRIIAHSDGMFSVMCRYNPSKKFATLEEVFAHYIENFECCDEDENENRHSYREED